MDDARLLTGDAQTSPRDVAEARRRVEASRARISSTLGELEERLVEKKQDLKSRLDVLRPVRGLVGERPLRAVAVAAGAGVLLGVLGSNEDEEAEELGTEEVEAIRRWRRERRRRLLATARDELPDFEPAPSRFGRFFRDVVHEVSGAATALLIAALVDRVRQRHEPPPAPRRRR